MTVPDPVLSGVESALEAQSGKPVRIVQATPVGGGCINPSARLESEEGEGFFLKWNPAAPAEMFRAEADGLSALGQSGALRIPGVFGEGGSGTREDPGWLLMEFIPQGRPEPEYGRSLGEGLATLHAWAPSTPGFGPDRVFGWHRDNFIGSLPQMNQPAGSWTTFWRDMRLEPQLRMARDRGYFTGGDGRVMDDLLSRLDSIMEGSDRGGPALLHGDLWSGNFYPGPSGEPVLIDPAVFRGSGEVDLAMMELFGSLPRGFVEGYGETRPLAPEYRAFRRALYQLYYLLVHVNLFGGGYVSGSVSAAQKALEGA
jgi:fructosamine-3-kinase